MVYDENGILVHKKTDQNAASTRNVTIIISELTAALESCKIKSGFVVTLSPKNLGMIINRVCFKNANAV